MAVEKNRLPPARSLLEAGAKPGREDKPLEHSPSIKQPLTQSPLSHDSSRSPPLILTQFNVADVADKSDQTALIKACSKNGAGLEMAQLLLAHKADLTPTDNKVRAEKSGSCVIDVVYTWPVMRCTTFFPCHE